MAATSPYSYSPEPLQNVSYPPASHNYFLDPHYHQPSIPPQPAPFHYYCQTFPQYDPDQYPHYQTSSYTQQYHYTHPNPTVPCSPPTLKLFKFSGSDPDLWLLNTELYFQQHPWSLETRFDFLLLHLEGFALTWFQLWRHQLDSWDKFREVFKFQFGQPRSGQYKESSVSGLENTTVGLENTTVVVSPRRAEHIKPTRFEFASGDEPHFQIVASSEVSEEPVLVNVVSTVELGNDETETNSKGSSTHNESPLITSHVVSIGDE